MPLVDGSQEVQADPSAGLYYFVSTKAQPALDPPMILLPQRLVFVRAPAMMPASRCIAPFGMSLSVCSPLTIPEIQPLPTPHRFRTGESQSCQETQDLASRVCPQLPPGGRHGLTVRGVGRGKRGKTVRAGAMRSKHHMESVACQR